MRTRTTLLATAFALSSSLALAQSAGNTAGGSSEAGGPAASKTTTGDSMNGATTDSQRGSAMKNGTTGQVPMGSSPPSGKDASTSGASTAGAADKKGDAASPGGTMKK